MKEQKKKAGILGIGNLLLSDESFGIHVVEYLEEHYYFPDTVTVMDGGTAGIYMAPFLEDHDPILIVDVMDFADADPGSLYSFSLEDVRNGTMVPRMSPHQLGIMEILDICKLRGIVPDRVEFFCVVPKSLATGLAMSMVVAARVEKISGLLVERLQELGYPVSRREAQSHA